GPFRVSRFRAFHISKSLAQAVRFGKVAANECTVHDHRRWCCSRLILRIGCRYSKVRRGEVASGLERYMQCGKEVRANGKLIGVNVVLCFRWSAWPVEAGSAETA